jgi:peptidyl-prolyl cis-trans isomerase B (cyclophilin B)
MNDGKQNLTHGLPQRLSASAFLLLLALTSAARAAEPGLDCQRRYVGVNQQLLLTVTAPREFGKVTLALMHYDGTLVTDPVEVRPGRVDLSSALPAIWALEKAAYLQMLDGEEPVGHALVLQPMLSRMLPVTEQSRRPDGSTYTRIVGWRDENAPPPPPPPDPAPDPETEAPPPTTIEERETASDGSTTTAPIPAQSQAPPQRIMSGLRIDPERDVLIRTTAGEIRLRMRHDAAPNTANNFLELCDGGFYEGIVFHRVVPLDRQGLPFVIQAGDPTGQGDGGPGYWLPIEPSTLRHDLGVISMARADAPDSAGSQFFLCLSRAGTSRLDGQYCAFGEAISGADAILAIATIELADAATGRPVKPPVILDVQLVPAPSRSVGTGRPDNPISDAPPIEPPKPKRVPR